MIKKDLARQLAVMLEDLKGRREATAMVRGKLVGILNSNSIFTGGLTSEVYQHQVQWEKIMESLLDNVKKLMMEKHGTRLNIEDEEHVKEVLRQLEIDLRDRVVGEKENGLFGT